MAIGVVFLVVVPALLFVVPLMLPSESDDMFPAKVIPAFLVFELFGPLFPFLAMSKLSLFARIALTIAEVLALAALFGWLARENRMRDQVLYAMLGVGALMLAAPFLYKIFLPQ